MKNILTTVGAIVTGVLVTGGLAVLAQDTAADQPQSPPYNWPNNNFTNRVVVPTVECYTNTEAAVAKDKSFRRSEGAGKGAAALQTGPRIEPRASSQYMEQDPKAHVNDPWDFKDTNANQNAWPGWSNWR